MNHRSADRYARAFNSLPADAKSDAICRMKVVEWTIQVEKARERLNDRSALASLMAVMTLVLLLLVRS